EVRSFPRSEARRRLAAPAVHVASAKVLLGRQQMVGRTPKLQVVHGVRAAQRVRFAVVQLQPASLRTAPSAMVGVSTSPRVARAHTSRRIAALTWRRASAAGAREVSGVALFEEAFDQGVRAANALLAARERIVR